MQQTIQSNEPLKHADQIKFLQMIQILGSIEGSEMNLTRIELLFFETLNTLRSYHQGSIGDGILQEIIRVKEVEFRKVYDYSLTRSQRRNAISRFKSAFSLVLRQNMKPSFLERKSET